MHSLFEPTTAAEIISRIQKLQPTSRAQWGKMNIAQLMAHCCAPLETYFSETTMKKSIIGILFSKMIFKQLISDKPWRKSLPTARDFKIADLRNFEEEKNRLVKSVNHFSTEGIPLLLSPILSWANCLHRNMPCLITGILIIIFSNLVCNGLLFVLISPNKKS